MKQPQSDHAALSHEECSVVVPVYNSEKSLPILVTEIVRVLGSICQRFEIVLVNDGSRDQSWEVIEHLSQIHPEVRGVKLMRNYGQHGALLAGIRQARFAVIVTLDDDLQTPPDEIPKLLTKLAEGYDLVYGTPVHEKHGVGRSAAARFTKLCLNVAFGAETARIISPFRAFRTQLREAFADYRSSILIIDCLLTWGTTRVSSVEVRHAPRAYGSSNYTFMRLIAHALNMVTGFSTAPLQVASWIGFGLTLFGAALLLYVVAVYVLNDRGVPGFPFLASIIVIFSGAQLFALGIIGEYMARMYFRMMERPPYVISELSGDPPHTSSLS